MNNLRFTINIAASQTQSLQLDLSHGRYRLGGGVSLTADAACVVRVDEPDALGGVFASSFPSGNAAAFDGPQYTFETVGCLLSVYAAAESGTVIGEILLQRLE